MYCFSQVNCSKKVTNNVCGNAWKNVNGYTSVIDDDDDNDDDDGGVGITCPRMGVFADLSCLLKVPDKVCLLELKLTEDYICKYKNIWKN